MSSFYDRLSYCIYNIFYWEQNGEEYSRKESICNKVVIIDNNMNVMVGVGTETFAVALSSDVDDPVCSMS